MRGRHWAAVLIGTGLLAAALAPAVGDDHALKGKKPPNFTLRMVGGGEVELASVKEKVIILDFWASWCGPCRRGLPVLQKIYDWGKKEKKSLAIYTINLREDEGTIKEAWKALKLSMPVLRDTDGAVAEKYEVEYIPTTVIIGGGKVADVHVGVADEKDLKAQIDRLLKAR